MPVSLPDHQLCPVITMLWLLWHCHHWTVTKATQKPASWLETCELNESSPVFPSLRTNKGKRCVLNGQGHENCREASGDEEGQGLGRGWPEAQLGLLSGKGASVGQGLQAVSQS